MLRSAPLWLLACLLATPSRADAQSARYRDSESTRADAAEAKAREGGPDLARVAGQVVESTNEFRRDEGRGEVKTNPELAKAARYFADYMARTDEYGHTADGNEPWERAKEYGYDYCIVLENIAYQYDSAGFTTEELARGFVKGWKESPGHRKNMLDRDVTETGVAVARSSDTGRYYAVQLFGRPKSAQISFKITNRAGGAVRYTVDGEEFTLDPRATRTHYRCRQPEVVLPAADAGGDKGKVLRPESGTQYAVRSDGSGGFAVQKK